MNEIVADTVTWLLLAQLLGESEDAQGDAFVQRIDHPQPHGFSNPPSATWTNVTRTRREHARLRGTRHHDDMTLEAIAYDAWRAIHDHLGVSLVDQPVVRDDVEREFSPGEIVRIFTRKK